MRIGELARRAGVTADTIRYYERVGLLSAPERSKNRYRVYSANVVEDVRFIKKAQSLGLRLVDIRQVVAMSSNGGYPCNYLKSVLHAHVADVDRQLRELSVRKQNLNAALDRITSAERTDSTSRCVAIDPMDSVWEGYE